MQANKVEGTLWKWTNYWNGWKPRWFVLDKNILSYYASQDEVSLGCKGSVNIASAVVTAHQSDPCRLDVVVPGEQHFYLKAGSPHERQNWLVALGSVKSSVNSEQAFKALDTTNRLTQKQCEVRLYCDALMQQIHNVKCLVNDGQILDVQKLDESSSLISETCDTFINALEDCIRLSIPHSPLDITGLTNSVFPLSSVNGHRSRSQSNAGHSSDDQSNYLASSNGRSNSIVPYSTRSVAKKTSVDGGDAQQTKHIATFFSEMKHSFSNLKSKRARDSSIDTVEFVKCSEELIKIFDLLNENAFAPIKLDLASNIRKILEKYNSHKEMSLVVTQNDNEEVDAGRFGTLQKVLLDEVNSKSAEQPNSATITLLWLIRGFQFISAFLHLFYDNMQKDYLHGSLTEMVNEAYGKTLKQHHRWVMRGVFTLAAKETVPCKSFYKSLFLSTNDVTTVYKSDECRRKLSADLCDFLFGLDSCLKQLYDFYSARDLLSDV